MVMEISNGIYLYDINIDLNETIEGLEDMSEMGNTDIKWRRTLPFSLKHKSIGFVNLEDDSKIDQEDGWHLFLHDLSKTSSEVFIESAIDYFKKKNMPKPEFSIFVFFRSEDGSKQVNMKDNYGNETGRTVSFKYFINDNYDGGEIEFVNLGIKIKPKSGQLLIHPAGYEYLEHEVKNGNKYQLSCWV
jgi:hypothetical protein